MIRSRKYDSARTGHNETDVGVTRIIGRVLLCEFHSAVTRRCGGQVAALPPTTTVAVVETLAFGYFSFQYRLDIPVHSRLRRTRGNHPLQQVLPPSLRTCTCTVRFNQIRCVLGHCDSVIRMNGDHSGPKKGCGNESASTSYVGNTIVSLLRTVCVH